MSTGSLVAYEKILNEHQTPDGVYELKVDRPGKQQIRFNLYDSPGLNDSNRKDELHVANIFDAVKRAGKIHMVLIVVGQGPCSPGLQDAIRCYLDIFPQFQDIMAIVHTKTNYKLLHPRDKTGVTMSNQLLLLEAATISKTPRMKAIDKLVEDKYADLSETLGDTLQQKDQAHRKLMSEEFKWRDAIAKNESSQKNAEDFIKANETDETELMDEFLYTDDWAHFRIIRPDTVCLKEQAFKIDVLNVYHHGFNVDNEEGGEDNSKPSIEHFQPRRAQNHTKVVPSDCCNILLLGETQVGKSTLVQEICQYANPKHQVKQEAIGDGFNSCTSHVHRYPIITNLPSYKTVDRYGTNPRLVDHRDIPTSSLEDYDIALNQYQWPDGPYELKLDTADEQLTQFNLYDTPGLNDSSGNDELHAANIFDAVKRAGNVHLVLIAVGQGPCSRGLQDAIRCYLDIFPRFQDIMAIVHTKTDYKLLHPQDPTGFAEKKIAKTRRLHEIIGRDNFPNFWINCELHCSKPVPKCLTQNTIQTILRIAMSNQPISLETILVSKTPRMRAVDKLVQDKYGDRSQSTGYALYHRDEKGKRLMAEMLKKMDEIAKNESDQRNAEAFIKAQETDEIELMDELEYSDNWAHFRIIRPGTVRLREQASKIDALHVFHPGFHLDNEEGGEGSTTWSARYKRLSYKNGTLRVQCYVKKRNKYKKQIKDSRERLASLKEENKRNIEAYKLQADSSKNTEAEVQELVQKSDLYTQIVKVVREDQLRPDLFRALAEAGAYQRTCSPADNIQKVVDVLTEFLNRPDINAPFRDSGDEVVQTIEEEEESFSSSVHPSLSPSPSSLHFFKCLLSMIHTMQAADAASLLENSKAVLSNCCNILLLGETQAGKSTIIQAICQYANPEHQVKREAIGDGFNSCTSHVDRYPIITNLPSYKTVDRNETNSPSAAHKDPSVSSFKDYDMALNQYQWPDGPYELELDTADKQQTRFNLYDTPGLNDSNDNDELHAANIFDAVKRAGNIHLVLIVVGQGPCSRGLQDAIRCYLDIFPQFQDIMAIVHTKTDYKLLHPQDPTGFAKNKMAKTKRLHEIIGRDNFPNFWINCELHCSKPVPRCITQNTIHAILRTAMINLPISLEAALIHKTPAMIRMDGLIESRYMDLFNSMEDTLHHMDEYQVSLMTDMIKKMDEIAKNESDQRNVKALIKAQETDETELMDELLYTDEWGHFRFNLPGTISLREQDSKIDVLHVFHPGFILENEKGGEGSRTWSARYQRRSFTNGVLLVRCYIKKRNKYKQQIKDSKEKLRDLEEEHYRLQASREEKAGASKKVQAQVDDLMEKNSLFTRIVEIIREDQMRPDLFRALAEAGAYQGISPADNIHKVMDILTEFLSRPDISAPFRDNGDVVPQTTEEGPKLNYMEAAKSDVCDDGDAICEVIGDLALSLPDPIAASTSSDWVDEDVGHQVATTTISTITETSNTSNATLCDESLDAVAYQVATLSEHSPDRMQVKTLGEEDSDDASFIPKVVDPTADTPRDPTLDKNNDKFAHNTVVVLATDGPHTSSAISNDDDDMVF
ncbi:hypothetical protein EMPS_03628 [Entomortierella parvispora]|uniref:G domain-containing protein n=1 Tax=Entomortierella parvispora TaxID=205924 RepID=A0A9P3H7L5_9FUNG|nr:hypothetical protein EMPS_03628 [Entomortierella parvispora]